VKINKAARAGTMESNDIYVMVYPKENSGIVIDLESIVIKQFGEQIRKVIIETIEKLDIKDIYVVAKDRGALDYTIKARIETAIKRAM